MALPPNGAVKTTVEWTLLWCVGALASVSVPAALAPWHRPRLWTFILAMVAGGTAFMACLLVLFAPGVILPSLRTGTLGLSFAIWFAAVGTTVVVGGLFVSSRAPRAWTWRPVVGVAALAIVVSGIGTALRHRQPLKPGSLAENPKDTQGYAWIPPGDFQMGCSTDDDQCAPDEAPCPRCVGSTQGFWIANKEVTVKAWEASGRLKPLWPQGDWAGQLYSDWDDEAMPVVYVTWQDAAEYCASVDGRLPTEAEWSMPPEPARVAPAGID